MSWTIQQVDDHYEWTVTEGDNTAEGTNPDETGALRDIARAIDWLQGGVNLASLDQRQTHKGG